MNKYLSGSDGSDNGSVQHVTDRRSKDGVQIVESKCSSLINNGPQAHSASFTEMQNVNILTAVLSEKVNTVNTLKETVKKLQDELKHMWSFANPVGNEDDN